MKRFQAERLKTQNNMQDKTRTEERLEHTMTMYDKQKRYLFLFFLYLFISKEISPFQHEIIIIKKKSFPHEEDECTRYCDQSKWNESVLWHAARARVHARKYEPTGRHPKIPD